ncbi:MAG: trimethylamine methyltransferase family protein [Clostridia bacterium]|jgi:trimethylamine--corrinoid protein Co-methyltransferase|nr:trimethylamine methyltransferase family protein [Clostridia bacterium]
MTIRSMQSSYTTKQGFSLDMYTEDELRAIHLATLEVLEKTGIKVYLGEALNIFEDAGAKVIRSEKLVKIPGWMVEDAIRSAPRTVLLAGRNPKYDVLLGGSRVNFTCFGAGVKVVDPDTGALRETTKADLGNTALFVDYLNEVEVYSQAVVPRDVNPISSDLHAAEAFLSNTSKHCHHIDLTCGAHAKKYFQMGAAIAGGMEELRERPVLSVLICPTSPLQLAVECCEIIIECARAGVPVNVLSMTLAGASSPITIAGTLVGHNAEVLSGIVLAQLANKGAPCIYGSSTTTFDMQFATAPVGSPELGMINAGVARLAQFYLLPSYTAGG